MVADWLPPESIFLVQPRTPEEVDAIADDIHALASLLPFYEPDFLDGGMRDYPEAFTVIYHDDQPVAYIEINDAQSHNLGKNSLEFGGSVLPEYRDKGLTQQVAPKVIRQAFKDRPKAIKMLANVPEDNHEARAAIVSLGFVHYGVHEGIARYKLTREKALAQTV